MTTEDLITQPITCLVSIKEITDNGFEKTLSLNEQQRAQLETILDISKLELFDCQFDLKSLHKDRFALTGKITANYEQKSAISLTSIPVQLRDSFSSQLWPISQNDPEKSPELDLEFEDEVIEFYQSGKLDIGQIIYEHFVISIDPFPRASGEAFEWGAQNEQDQQKENPFAALKILKK